MWKEDEMAKEMWHPWDRKMKRLLIEAPEDFVAWLLKGASFQSLLSAELDADPVYADILCEVLFNGRRVLLHIEFQKRRDTTMAKRLWEYNVRATLQYKCPVWSCVIYLKKDGNKVADPPLTWERPDGQSIHLFHYSVIKLWEIPTEELLRTGLKGLLPLLPLTQEGQRREVVEEAIARLNAPGEESHGELLALIYGVASLAFEKESDQEWLAWRFNMLYEILRDTRAFQEMAKEGRKEGLKEGRKEGLKEGHKKGLQAALQTLVEARFPDSEAIHLLKEKADTIEDPGLLQRLIVKAGTAQRAEEVVMYLFKEFLDKEE